MQLLRKHVNSDTRLLVNCLIHNSKLTGRESHVITSLPLLDKYNTLVNTTVLVARAVVFIFPGPLHLRLFSRLITCAGLYLAKSSAFLLAEVLLL